MRHMLAFMHETPILAGMRRLACLLFLTIALGAQDKPADPFLEKKITLDFARAEFARIIGEIESQACPGKKIQLVQTAIQEQLEPKFFQVRVSSQPLLQALDSVAETFCKEGGKEVRFRLDPPDVIMLATAPTYTSAQMPFRQIPKAYAGVFSLALTRATLVATGLQLDLMVRREFESFACIVSVSNVTVRAGKTSFKAFEKEWKRLVILNPNTRERIEKIVLPVDSSFHATSIDSLELDFHALIPMTSSSKEEALGLKKGTAASGGLNFQLTSKGEVWITTADGTDAREAVDTSSVRLVNKKGDVLASNASEETSAEGRLVLRLERAGPEDATLSLKRYEAKTKRCHMRLTANVQFPIEKE